MDARLLRSRCGSAPNGLGAGQDSYAARPDTGSSLRSRGAREDYGLLLGRRLKRLRGWMGSVAPPWVHRLYTRTPFFRASTIADRRSALNDLKPVPKVFDCIVSSAGGAATSMLLEFLSQYCNTNDPGGRDLYDQVHLYKHLASPPRLEKDTTKVLFLYADPVDVVLSLHRRDHAFEHSIRLGSRKLWFPRNVERFAASGRDLLRLEAHFDAWISPAAREYEILVLRYERLWDNLDVILQHIGLRADLAAHFPAKQKRQSHSWEGSPTVIAQLRTIYGPLIGKMQRLHDVELL